MATLRGDERLFTRASLEDAEARLSAALASVRTSLNQLVPVAWVPVEILEQIFMICVSWLYGYQKPKSGLAWTQVCRLWRQTSLNSPRLWRCIDLCNTQFADEFLVRSKSTPLSIVSTSPLKLSTDCLIKHAERLHSIDVFLFPDDMAKLFANIGPNLSTLTNLTLRIPPMSSCLVLDVALPSVRRLVLDCISVRWDDCQKLTHLSIRGLTPELSPTYSQLHAIFARSPYLEYVRLESLMPADILNIPTQIVPLTYLKEITISAQSSVILSVLAGITFKCHTRLQLYCPLSDNLHYLFPDGRLPHLQDGCSCLEVAGLRLARHAAYFTRFGARPWLEDSKKTTFSISSSSWIATHVLNSLQSIINLSCITNLEFSTAILLDIPSNSLRTLLVNLVNLRILRLAFNDLGELLDILTPSLQSSPSNIVCPQLSTLSFNRPGDLWWHFKDNWLQSVLECVFQRHTNSVPVQVLEFLRCHGVTTNMKEQIQAIVPEVCITAI